MNTKRLVLALSFGLTVAIGANIVSKQLNPSKDVKTQEVVVVAKPIARGASLTKEMLAIQSLPVDSVPEGAITEMKVALNRVVAVAVRKGVLLTGHLASKEKKGIRALLDEGLRAFTIHTPDLASGVAGLLRPGDHVDVLLTVTNRRSDDPAGGAETVTLLQDIEILAVDQNLTDQQPKEENPRRSAHGKSTIQSVTLMATPEQTVRLSLAQSKGTLHLSLRNSEIVSTGAVEQVKPGPAVTFNELLGRETPKEPVVSPLQDPVPVTTTTESVQPIPAIITYRGSNRGVVEVRSISNPHVPAQKKRSGLAAKN